MPGRRPARAQLALLGRRAELHFGSPQDLEWAIDGDGKPWLTQSRPITTLYPLPDETADLPGGRRASTCASAWPRG